MPQRHAAAIVRTHRTRHNYLGGNGLSVFRGGVPSVFLLGT